MDGEYVSPATCTTANQRSSRPSRRTTAMANDRRNDRRRADSWCTRDAIATMTASRLATFSPKIVATKGQSMSGKLGIGADRSRFRWRWSSRCRRCRSSRPCWCCTRREPRPTGLAFLVGWLFGLAALTAIFLEVSSLAGGLRDKPPTWASWLRIVVGAALIVFGLYSWFTRNRSAHTPGWMNSMKQVHARAGRS